MSVKVSARVSNIYHRCQNVSLQVYFYSFDIFRAAGIAEEQLSYTALGTGLCEVTVSLACVSHVTPKPPTHPVSPAFLGLPLVSDGWYCALTFCSA